MEWIKNSTKIPEQPAPSFWRIKTITGDTYTADHDQIMAAVGPRFTKELNPDLKDDIIYPWHQIAWIKEHK